MSLVDAATTMPFKALDEAHQKLALAWRGDAYIRDERVIVICHQCLTATAFTIEALEKDQQNAEVNLKLLIADWFQKNYCWYCPAHKKG